MTKTPDPSLGVHRVLRTRAGWRLFKCDECGEQWQTTSRDIYSPSGEDCCCGAWVRPYGQSQDPPVATDKMGNVIEHRSTLVTKDNLMESETNAADASVDRVVHTPGPWRLSNVISAYEIKRRKIVAAEQSPEAGTGICEVYGIEDANNIANAKLIAAAPDLLEALQLLWTEVSESGNATANDFGWRKARETTLAALRKVL